MAIAKAVCKCAKCGAEFIIRKEKYNRREADEFEAWAAENITECPDCRAVRVQAEREAKIAEAGADQLPELSGSPKQVAWANTIRQKAQVSLIDALSSGDGQQRVYKAAIAIVSQITRAAWWIDNRANVDNSYPLVLALAKDYPEGFSASALA